MGSLSEDQSERDLLDLCMSIPADGYMVDDMFEDLEQTPGQQSTPHTSSGESGSFAMQASEKPQHAGSAAGTGAGAANLTKAFSEPPTAALFSAPGGTWFARSPEYSQQQHQQQQHHSGPLAAELDSNAQTNLAGAQNLHRLSSDTGPSQPWAASSTNQSAALTMLLGDTSRGSRRPSGSSVSEGGPTGQPTSSPLGPLLANLSHEQLQLLANAGLDASTLLQHTRQPELTPSTDPQLEMAETIWQQVASSGADDQTLLSLAASLGLITNDPATGAVVLTRELGRRPPVQPGQRMAPQVNYTSPQAPLSARASLFGASLTTPNNLQTSPKSSPLPKLTQPGLAALLALSAGNTTNLRLPGSSPQVGGKTGSSPGPSKQHTLYKTELCRGWLEAGTCRYGSKCQFAHGREELRPVPRHPKYKTEVCRSFTATGVCAYGPRCRFIHGMVSAPTNAIFDAPGLGSRIPDATGMEGVLGFDDMPSNSSLTTADTIPAGGPRHQLLSALNTPVPTATVLRQSSIGTDSAAMARIAARLLAVGGRTSLDSAASANRPSWSGMGRMSTDSRINAAATNAGRISLESCMSQGDVLASDPTSTSSFIGSGTSSLTAESLLSLSASLAAANQAAASAHHPYMPGIPEGMVMNLANLPGDSWAGVSTAAQQQQQRVSADLPLNFLLSKAGSGGVQDVSTLGFGPQQGNVAWWDAAVAATKQRQAAEQLASSLHLSAYQSGLYGSTQGQVVAPHMAGVRVPSPSGMAGVSGGKMESSM